MRTFLAIDLPDDIRDQVSRLQDHLRTGRKVPPENLHLTLTFLGDQSQAVLQELHEALSVLEIAPFSIALAGLDMFGGKTPRVLFLRAQQEPGLTTLRNRVVQCARDVGIDVPQERFRPHVTLARFPRDFPEAQAVRLGEFLRDHGDVRLPVFDVEDFVLFGSVLHPNGAVHEALMRYPIGT